jgi:integrase
LIELRQLTGKLEWAFPNAIIADAPMSENALSSLLIRAGYKDIHVPHGWRSTFSTVMNGRRPQDRAYIDLMLAHKVKDKIESAYNRQPYWPARRDIAQEWANILLAGMAPPAELVKLERRGNSAWNKVDLTATV